MKTKRQIESEGFKVKFTNGSGAGGQKRNRTYTVAVVYHGASGIVKRCDETRVANKNMNIAYNAIMDILRSSKKSDQHEKRNDLRKEIMAKGVIRTYDFKRGIVKSNVTGKEANLKKVLDGKIDLIQDVETLTIEDI